MKRNMDLVRELLLLIELHPEAQAPAPIALLGHQADEINYHLALLLDAELIDGTITMVVGHNYPEVEVNRLTWAGHDFLDTAREDVVWKRALTILTEKGAATTLDVLRALLVSLTKKAIGLEP